MTPSLQSFLPGSLKKLFRKKLFGSENFGIHFSQSGEDVNLRAILLAYLGIEKGGFYIDVGSFHPHDGSNTYLFYREGWKGINIDPRPGSKKLFDQERPNDINLEVGIGSVEGNLSYYFIDETSTMNSFSKQTLEENGVLDQVTKVIECPIWPLSKVIDQYLPKDREIDFISIDAEGFELEILASFDLMKVRPKIIAVEQNNINTLKDVIDSGTYKFLESKNYQPIGKNVIAKRVSTVLYIDNRFI